MNKLRKFEDDEIQKAATDVLMQWKDLMLPLSKNACLMIFIF